MMREETEPLTRLLRAQMTAVHQQFCHILALRQWQDEALLPRIAAVDGEDFRNAMQIADLLVSRGQRVALAPQHFRPGSSPAAVLRAELEMELRLSPLLEGLQVVTPEATALAARARAPRRSYRDWLDGQIAVTPAAEAGPETPPELAALLAALIVLVEQAMLHAFLQWHAEDRPAADDAWRLSGAAMLYATAIVKRGALAGAVPGPGAVATVTMAEDPAAAFAADKRQAAACAALAHRAAAANDGAMGRLCRRIAEDCDPLAVMVRGAAFPAVFGRSPAFESFGATRERFL
jgi:bacterioferritin (cytochrome b1)